MGFWLDMPCESNSADLSISMELLQSTDFILVFSERIFFLH